MFSTVEIIHVFKQLKIAKCERKCNLFPYFKYVSSSTIFQREKSMVGNKNKSVENEFFINDSFIHTCNLFLLDPPPSPPPEIPPVSLYHLPFPTLCFFFFFNFIK